MMSWIEPHSPNMMSLFLIQIGYLRSSLLQRNQSSSFENGHPVLFIRFFLSFFKVLPFFKQFHHPIIICNILEYTYYVLPLFFIID